MSQSSSHSLENVILFGPPGSGKSSVIAALKSAGCRAVDLEDIYPSKARFSMPSWLQGVFIGGADLNPRRKYHKCYKVLLFCHPDIYEMRRAHRDAKMPWKATQAKHDMRDWLVDSNHNFDWVLDTSNELPQETAAKLMARFPTNLR